ncbi:DUF916 domain-containing protein [Arthrobacter sp. NamB2]|uniref:WxL protein peptidoglycan domain-containing protein n=1 Tax=Arthrobacter sp. NamB2 TaxID=2576035 RepID=UPI0010C9587B|nr:DUF916 domain-containing protein [Arthrobacter sp. NamB2]TKV28836.1 DUF916 domain-containing protein [Arthrobacter sp. NamB2]
MPHALRARTTALLLVLAFLPLSLAGLVSPQPALATADAEQQPVELSLRPADQPGPYFALTMSPGESRELAVELGNQGTVPIEALTYAADAYTVINGGFGAKERGSSPTGTTEWVSYPTEVVELPTEQGITRAFSVTVPPGTEPGQYLTSLVLENNVAVEGSGDVALDQIVRQAIAVSIEVPGPSTPALAVHAASHSLAAERSVVDVAIANTGNTSLMPAGELLVRDADGTIVSRSDVAMDVVYARTSTQVRTTLAGALEPGEYTATLTVTDDATATAATGTDLRFTVAAPASAASTSTEAGELPPILQDEAGAGATSYFIGVIALLAVVIIVLLVRRRTQASPAVSRQG